MTLGGCSQLTPRMQADTPSAFNASIREYVATGTWKTAAERQELADAVRMHYVSEEGEQWRDMPPEDLPSTLFHGLRQADFHRLAYRVLDRPTKDEELFRIPEIDPAAPLVRARENAFYLQQLKLQQAILLRRKERSRQQDLFTIDQLAFADATFIPPQDGQPFMQDYARFSVKVLNNTVFNLYRPSFRVMVIDDRGSRPILDLVLTHEEDDPLEPGEVTHVILECCDAYRAEHTNQMLRTLAPNARTSMHLVGIEDYRKRNVIENIIFSAEQHLQLVATERCISEMEDRLLEWSPASSRGCAGV